MDKVDEALAAVGAILVDERTQRRIIKYHRRIQGVGLQVPHVHGYAVSRAELGKLIPAERFGDVLEALPAQVAVISGDRAELAAGSAAAWLRAWRHVFHARVHRTFDELIDGRVIDVAAIRARIQEIGPTAFDEARSVLHDEHLLLPPVDDLSTYVEFAAYYLELSHFAPHQLAHNLPTLHDASRVVDTIRRDIDDDALLAATRPGEAPDSPAAPEAAVEDALTTPPPQLDQVGRIGRKLSHNAAARARQRGNNARAAILAWRATGKPESSRAELEALVARLSKALGDADSKGWVDALLPVARFAAGRRVHRFSAGARLLHDLQAACVVAERDLEVVDVRRWALSRGKASLVRALPATREVRVARHIRAAAKKIARCQLGSADDRSRLASAVRAMVARANQNIRDMLRPKIEMVLSEVGLRPRHLPERVAQKKLVDELLDRAVEVGRLSIGDLRDAISKNDLKLPDVRVIQLVTGDQLLRADRSLARDVDGVYRRGESYLRFLQKMSSVLSGNLPGRLLTLYLLLPAVGSFFLVQGAQHMVDPVARGLGYPEPHLATTPVLIGMGVFLFLLLHVRIFRRAVVFVLRLFGRGLRAVFSEFPRLLWRVPLVPPLVRWVVLPGTPAAIALLINDGPYGWIAAAGLFLVGTLIVNSTAASEVISDWMLRSTRHLARRVLPGILKYAIELFSWLVDWFERGIYRIDEALRFRRNQSKVMAVFKGVLSTLWSVIAYFLRLYVNLMIEPTINPIKHFPTVTVAAKLILPFTPVMISAIGSSTSGVLGPALGASLGAFTVFFLPGLAGFLAWELNSNWKLYDRNRVKVLGPVSIGSHGESMVGLLKPGFHSGTLPKLHRRLRRAIAKDDERGVARQKEGLHHVEEAIWKFTDRQLASMLNAAPPFRADDVAVEHVDLASNRVRITIVCPSVSSEPMTITFEHRAGWLIASISQVGWIDALDEDQRHIFEIALGGFYKLSGIDLVREQLEEAFDAELSQVPPYDISDEGLRVWPGPGYDTEIVYDLRAPTVSVSIHGGPLEGRVPELVGRDALFGRDPIPWTMWSATWERLGFGMEPPRAIVGPRLLPQG